MSKLQKAIDYALNVPRSELANASYPMEIVVPHENRGPMTYSQATPNEKVFLTTEVLLREIQRLRRNMKVKDSRITELEQALRHGN